MMQPLLWRSFERNGDGGALEGDPKVASRLGKLSRLLRHPRQSVAALRRRWAQPRRRRIRVSLDRVLRGGDNGVTAAHYARIVGDPMLPSCPLASTPHVRLLEQYDKDGEAIFEPAVLENTDYYRNAFLAMDAFGHYFDARSPEHLPAVVKRFVDQYRGDDLSHLPQQRGQSRDDDPVSVRPIAESDCYQVYDGHHRLAIAFARGVRELEVVVEDEAVQTPLQLLLKDVLWLQGRRELYQPVASPELEAEWTLVRKCSDRFGKMRAFLSERSLVPPTCATYLDIGSSYGWFVERMASLGFETWGVERDPIAARVGEWVYGLRDEQTIRSDCTRFLKAAPGTYDVTSCFSLLHHFALGMGAITAEEFARLLDRVTGRVLFFETGQGDEAWFRDTLGRGRNDWDPPFIERWLREHTSFREILPLGRDEDAVPPFEENYSRMLFACVR
jgi:hypothetical protein